MVDLVLYLSPTGSYPLSDPLLVHLLERQRLPLSPAKMETVKTRAHCDSYGGLSNFLWSAAP